MLPRENHLGIRKLDLTVAVAVAVAACRRCGHVGDIDGRLGIVSWESAEPVLKAEERRFDSVLLRD